MTAPTKPRPRVVPAPPAWHPKLFTVGVTGTNGKTTTTAWVAAALRVISHPVARATTVGFFLDDVELKHEKTYDGFLAGMRACFDQGGTHAAIELTSEALANGFIRAWPCRVGVFTNLTHDHLDAHGTPEHYLASKAQLFVSLEPGQTAVLNASDENFELLREITPTGVTIRTYAVPARGAPQGEPDVVARGVDVGWRGTRIALDVKDPASGIPAEISVRAVGSVYAENALAALLGAIAAGVPPEAAARAIAEAPPPPGRFEVIHERPYVVVDYAHSPDALARTVKIARDLATGGARLTTIFGAGGKRDKDKRAPMGNAARPSDEVILTTDNPRDEEPAEIARAIQKGLAGHADVKTILDRRAAIESAIGRARDEDVILIAGKGHETDQTIGKEVRHFSDVEVAREALGRRS